MAKIYAQCEFHAKFAKTKRKFTPFVVKIYKFAQKREFSVKFKLKARIFDEKSILAHDG